MTTTEKQLRKEYRKHSTAKLREMAKSLNEYAFERHLALQIIEDREFRRNFWTSGIVAWIALGLSVISIIATLFSGG